MNLFGWLSEDEISILNAFGILKISSTLLPHEKLVKCRNFMLLNQHILDSAYEIKRIVYDLSQEDNSLELHFSKKYIRLMQQDLNDATSAIFRHCRGQDKKFFLHEQDIEIEEQSMVGVVYPSDIRLQKKFSDEEVKQLLARMHNALDTQVAVTITL
jgi:hypothetical protein